MNALVAQLAEEELARLDRPWYRESNVWAMVSSLGAINGLNMIQKDNLRRLVLDALRDQGRLVESR